jgi:PAS domain S-box-containing protein
MTFRQNLGRDMRSARSERFFQHLADGFQRLTEPDARISQPEDRRKAQLLATLILAVVPISAAALLISANRFSAATMLADYGYAIIILSLGIISLLYILSRTPYYQVAAVLTILYTSFSIILTPITSVILDIDFLGYLIIPVLLSNIFISVRFSALLLVIYTLALWAISRLLPGYDFAQILAGPLLLVLTISVVLIMANRFRRLIERDRRSALATSEHRYRMVSELMSDYAYSIRVLEDGSLRADWITGAFYEITGYDPRQVVDVDVTAIIHPDDALIARRRLESLMQGQVDTSEFRIITRDGRVRWLRDSGLPVWDAVSQRVTGVYGAATDITDQHQAEEQLRLLGKAIHEVGDGIIILAIHLEPPQPQTVFVSDGLLRLTGYTRDELMRDPALLWQGLRDGAARLVDVQARMLKGEIVLEEARGRRKDGTTYDVEWFIAPVADQQGTVTHFIAIQRDVTRRKLAESAEREQRILAEALRDTAAALTGTLRLEEVLDRILINVSQVVPHDSGNIMLIDDNIGRVVRYHLDGDFEAVVPERHLRFVIDETPTMRQMCATGQPVLVRDTRAYADWADHGVGQWIRSYLGVPILIGGEVIGFINLDSAHPNHFSEKHLEHLRIFADQASTALRNATLFDEMEQRVIQRTAELERERKQLQAILDSTGEGMYYVENGLIRYINPALAQLTGYTPEEMIGQPGTRLFHPDNSNSPEEIRDDISNTLRRQPVWRRQVRLVDRDNRVIEAALTVSLVSAPGEWPMRTVTVVRDIGQEKALEDRKNRFISTASHELRTPITNITTRLYLIRRQPDHLDEHLQVMESVTERMKRLAEDLLDMTRLEYGQITLDLQPVVLQSLVAEVLQTQQAEADKKRITLQADMTDEPLHVLADANRIMQVITNLVINAINYTPINGRVRVALRAQDSGDNSQRYAELRVIDTGVGIAHEHLPHIFESFYRIDERVKGTGLGLSISREIVEQHGGSISVESQEGEGSTFTIRLALLPR